MNRTNRIVIYKYTSYALLLFLLYVLQTVPGLFVIARVKPVWVVTAAVAIAMVEGEFVGGIYGAFAGLLCDLGGFSLFGFNAFFLCFCCIGAGLLVIHLMHSNLWSCTLFVLAAMGFMKGVEYYFAFGIWDIDSSWKIFAYQMLPVILYSAAVSPISYLVVRKMHRAFAADLRT